MSTGTGTMIQTPIIGNALRERIGLDAAGRMPMTMGDEVIPVAIVADVRDLVDSSPVDVMGYAIGPAVAARYTRCGIQFQQGIRPAATRIIIDSMTLVSNTTQFVYATLKSVLPAFNITANPQRKLSSLALAQTNARVWYDDAAAFPAGGDLAFSFSLIANTPLRIVFEHPIILDRQGDVFAVCAGTVNTNLVGGFEWREELRQ